MQAGRIRRAVRALAGLPGLLGLWLVIGLTPFASVVAAPTAPIPIAAPISVTDIAGRRVTLPAPARRIVLGEARHLSVLGLILPDPVAPVVGWRLDKPLDPPTLAAWRARFPAIEAIRPVGSGNRGLSVETVLALQPDLVVLSLMDEGDPAMINARRQIAAAGIAVVTVDFFAHPLKNTIPSLRILGALTGAAARAEDFARFYETRLTRIETRLTAAGISGGGAGAGSGAGASVISHAGQTAAAGDTGQGTAARRRPSVFVHVHAAAAGCCATVGNGVFDEFITAAGGRNIAAAQVPGVQGHVSLEALIGADPDVYVATGGAHMAARGGLVLGPQVGAGQAAASFAALTGSTGFSSLRAVREGRGAGIWHLFNDTPAHIALIEYLAKLLHPDLFADLDPDATLAEAEGFAAVTVPGTWWVRGAP